MYNIHLDFMERARFCDPTGGFATMGVLMAVGAVGGGMAAYGQHEEGKAKSKMYRDAAGNTDIEAAMAQQTAAQNVMLTQRQMAQTIHATQMDASFQDKNLKEAIAKVRGTQTATAAAMGVGGGSVTSADIAMDTLNKEKMDEIAIRYNADSETAKITNEGNSQIWGINNDLNNQTWALGVQKNQYLSAAKNAKTAGNIKAAATILSTIAQVGSMGMDYNTYAKKKVGPGSALLENKYAKLGTPSPKGY